MLSATSLDLADSLLDLFTETDGVTLGFEDDAVESITDDHHGEFLGIDNARREDILGKLAIDIDTEAER